jgi:hypothetical protein
MAVSFNPDTFVKGGLIQDVDVEIIGGRCTLEPPEGYSQRDRVFVELELKVLDTDEEVTQYWSAGKNTDFVPSSDGDELVPTGSRGALNDNSNWSIFCQNLANCQFPKDRLETGKLSALVGTQLHVVRIPAPERAGLAGPKGEGDRKQTILVPNKLIRLPGEKKARGRGAKPAKDAGAEPEEQEGSVTDDQIFDAVSEIAASSSQATPLGLLKAALLKRFLSLPASERNRVIARGSDPAWLKEHGLEVKGGALEPIG